jgi:hypothetical protein
MMSDLIDQAKQRVATQTQDANLLVSDKADLLKDSLVGKLPLDKNPELILRQKQAEILEKKAKVDELLAVDAEEKIEELKATLKALALASLPGVPKLPVIDPKILQGVAIAKQIKALIKQRSALAKLALSKGKELYSYPVKKLKSQKTLADAASGLPTLPDRSNLPGVPAIPRPPQLPSVPTIPKLPLR